MDVSRRIVLIGKTGSGKSSVGNTILRDAAFEKNHSANSQPAVCRAETRVVRGADLTLIDTPGVFDTSLPDHELRRELAQCVVEGAPGPHAFLIVLKVERFTAQEEDVVAAILRCFSPEALRYAVVLFTHGDQLPEETTIRQFVCHSQGLVELVEKCSGRCHVVDNRYWNDGWHAYRSNKVQVEELLDTIEQIVLENNGGFYTSDLLQLWESETVAGKSSTRSCIFLRLAAVTVGGLAGALVGLAQFMEIGLLILHRTSNFTQLETAYGTGKVLAIGSGCSALMGALIGGCIGYGASEGAGTTREAARRATAAVWNSAEAAVKKTMLFFGRNA